MRFVRYSSVLVGILMVLQWVFFVVSGNVPEFDTAPVSIGFHIAIELLTALLLIYAALVCRTAHRQEILLLYGQGMLGYTVVNSAGYFAQSGQWVFLLMFACVLAVSIANTVLIGRRRSS